MNRNVVAGLLALLLILGAGITEVLVVSNRYKQMSAKCDELISLAENSDLTLDIYTVFSKEWSKLRTLSELLLPHTDVYEVTLRISEAEGYLIGGMNEDLVAQLKVIKTLLQYIPDNVIPDFHHIV